MEELLIWVLMRKRHDREGGHDHAFRNTSGRVHVRRVNENGLHESGRGRDDDARNMPYQPDLLPSQES